MSTKTLIYEFKIDVSNILENKMLNDEQNHKIGRKLPPRLQKAAISRMRRYLMYLVENPNYARQMAELALSTEDAELIRLVSRLDSVMDVFNYEETAVIEKPKQVDTTRHELDATEEVLNLFNKNIKSIETN